jgi:phosphoribosylformylglycinamidine (FGAM) synthase-like amidotransferase family enzyme
MSGLLPAQSIQQMPHPERASEPALGSDDGKWIFEGIFDWLLSNRDKI